MCHRTAGHALCGAVLLAALFHHADAAGRQWSMWYNSDSPDSGAGDNETIQRISLIFGLPCSPENITSVQCRRHRDVTSTPREEGEEEQEVFHHQHVFGGNVLHVPCNASGLLCRHQDQMLMSSPSLTSSSSFLTACVDYEIRLMCYGEEDDSGQSDQPDNYDITSSGVFVGVVAGGSVILPLILGLLLRIRKTKLAQRQQDREAQQAAQNSTREEEGEGGNTDLPPSYDVLFSSPEPPESGVISEDSSGGSVGVRSGSNSSADWLVGDHVTGAADHVGRGVENHGGSFEETSSSGAPSRLVDIVVSDRVSDDAVVGSSSRGLQPAFVVNHSSDSPVSAAVSPTSAMDSATPDIVSAVPDTVIATPTIVSAASAVVAATPDIVSTTPAIVSAASAVISATPDIIATTPAVVSASPATVSSFLATISSGTPLRRVSSESSASSTSSTRALLTPVSSENDVIHHDPPPAYDWPSLPGVGAVPSHVIAVAPVGSWDGLSGSTTSVGSVSEESANDCSSSGSNLSAPVHQLPPRVRTPQRRFLGMHLSVVDLMSMGYPPTDRTPIPTRSPSPPPTYDDALKILEAPERPSEIQVV